MISDITPGLRFAALLRMVLYHPIDPAPAGSPWCWADWMAQLDAANTAQDEPVLIHILSQMVVELALRSARFRLRPSEHTWLVQTLALPPMQRRTRLAAIIAAVHADEPSYTPAQLGQMTGETEHLWTLRLSVIPGTILQQQQRQLPRAILIAYQWLTPAQEATLWRENACMSLHIPTGAK